MGQDQTLSIHRSWSSIYTATVRLNKRTMFSSWTRCSTPKAWRTSLSSLTVKINTTHCFPPAHPHNGKSSVVQEQGEVALPEDGWSRGIPCLRAGSGQPRRTQSSADPWIGHSGDHGPAHSTGREEMKIGRADPAQHIRGVWRCLGWVSPWHRYPHKDLCSSSG